MKEYVDQDSSDRAKSLMLFYVITSLILCGGNVFGFTPLKQIFLDEGIYEDYCLEDANATSNATAGAVDDAAVESLLPPPPCEEQLMKLDGMFTLAASLFSAWLLPAGLCLKFLGPRICFLSGFAFVFGGSLVFAKAHTDYYTAAYVMIGTGNPLLYISAFNFSKLYPKSSNLLLSIFIGCFGFSSVVFYVFNLIFYHFDGDLSSRQIFLGYSILPILLSLIGLIILPPDPYHIQYQKKLEAMGYIKPDDVEEAKVAIPEKLPLRSAATNNKNNNNNNRYQNETDNLLEVPEASETETPSDTEGEDGKELPPLKERTIPQQLISSPFIAQAIFFCFGMLHQNFYLATLGDQIYLFAGDNIKDQSTTAEILHQFAILYPVGCILAILPVGALVRNASVATSLYVYSGANIIFAALSLVPSVEVQWITSSIYIVVRVGFFTVMSTYSANIFGFQNLSAMFGCAGALAGMCSLLGSVLNHRALYVDHSFLPVNSVLLAGAVINFAFPMMVQRCWEDK